MTAAVGPYVRIEATILPGRNRGSNPDAPNGYHNVHVAVQRVHVAVQRVHVAVQQRGRPDDLYQLHPADAAAVVWMLNCTAQSNRGRHRHPGSAHPNHDREFLGKWADLEMLTAAAARERTAGEYRQLLTDTLDHVASQLNWRHSVVSARE